MKWRDLEDCMRFREAAGVMMVGVDYGINRAEEAGDHGGSGTLALPTATRGRGVGEPGLEKPRGGTEEVRLESTLGHPIFPKPPLRLPSACPQKRRRSWSCLGQVDFFNLEPG